MAREAAAKVEEGEATAIVRVEEEIRGYCKSVVRKGKQRCWHIVNEHWTLSYADSLTGWLEEMWTGLAKHLLEKIVIMHAKKGLFAVREAKAIVAREALSWLKDHGWQRFVLETDVQVVTHVVTAGQSNTPFGFIIQEIRTLLRHMPLVEFRFVPRSRNMIAHSLARHALNYEGEGMLGFFDSVPGFISAFCV
ncbi:PREDICTED: uncharacterized protein LOC109151138 [Ipomoea nil]|uniref:uncharacterized protein LOC109151138 n=1 Tax=Ipomoea nil TaxID=35883 RepID=UPI000901B55E|nr:PREDICTED: uncharacterized protein LOC109151138 [Ipomoea nil]